VLAIETSTMMGGVAVMDEERGLLSEVRASVKAGHSERLMAECDHALQAAGVALGDLGALAVAIGPGSFTGLRIGLATAKGLAFGAGLRVVGVPSLEAMAWNLGLASWALASGPVCPMFDARRGQVWTAVFAPTPEGGMRRMVPEGAMHVRELLALVGGGERVVFAGEGAVLYRDEIASALGGRAVFAPPHLDAPSPAAVASLGIRLALAGEWADPSALAPRYIRKSGAETPPP
jgi:tRNA threonylcarbamoyladenosine biosynthesis protein TsaB